MNSNKEHVILKFGEWEEIRYLHNGILYIDTETPIEIIGSDKLKTLDSIDLTGCTWKECPKLRIPDTIRTLYLNESVISIHNFLDNFPYLENLNISKTFGFGFELLRNKINLI